MLQPDGSWQQVGPTVDLMIFSISRPGTFYASSQPAAGVDLPAPVGLIKSTDAGSTWTVQSRGKSDFHAMTASTAGVMGYDGILRTRAGGKSWTQGGLTAAQRALASAPDGSQVLANHRPGSAALHGRRQDLDPLASAQPLFLTAWADAKTVVSVTTKESVAISVDAGQTWNTDPAKVTSRQALCASRDKAGCWRPSSSPTPERCSHTTEATLTELKS